MTAPISPESGSFAGGQTGKALSLRAQCELQRMQIELERQSFISDWRDLSDFIMPRRARFTVTDTNRGGRRGTKIVDGAATMSARTLSSGMMAGVTSPARPWFLLSTPDPQLNESEPVKVWLHDVGTLMMDAFRKSNLYNALPIVYGDMGVFGTGAVFMEEDDQHVFRFTTFAIGEYGIALDHKLKVRTLVRTFRLTVDQVVRKWGNIDAMGRPDFIRESPDGTAKTTSSPISLNVQNLWRRQNLNAWVNLVHLIRPNLAYDGTKIDPKYKAFEEIYYELAAPNQPTDAIEGVLSHSGYDEFPLFAPRWEVASGDVYGTNCPGMVAIGDVRELQLRRKRTAQGVEKMISPPMVGPSAMRTAKASILPGDITYADMNQHNAFRPAHEVNFSAAINPMETAADQCAKRIQRAFYEDLFLMLSESDRREITATEIEERKQEKLLALGPMLEQLNQDLLDPLIDRAFNIMSRKGLLPPAPPELEGQPLKIEYVSIMAQAQKQVGLASLERFAGFVGQVAQYDTSVLDKVDGDEMITYYGDATGIPPKIVRSDDQVQQLRATRAQQQQAEQAAENAPKLAGAAKDLAQTPTGGDSVLASIIGRARARQTLNATAAPPVALAG